MLLKENLEYSMMHSELWCHASHNIIISLLVIQRNKVANERLFYNSTTRTLLLRKRIIVRTQIYENLSSSKNKEQTQELFFSAITDFSNENLSLRESLSSILRDTEPTRISTVDSQRLWIYQEFKSHTIFDVSSIQVTYNLEKLRMSRM